MLRFEEASAAPVRPSEDGAYETDAAEFELHVATTSTPHRPLGPEIVLVPEGEPALAPRGAAPLPLPAGPAAVAPAALPSAPSP